MERHDLLAKTVKWHKISWKQHWDDIRRGCSYGLILITYILSYPKAVSDSMQKEIRHKQKKGRNESEIKGNLWKKKEQNK